MAWCKYEGPPLAATLILAAALTLVWLRPPGWVRRLGQLTVPLAGLVAGYLPWRLFIVQQKLEIGADHIQGFYPHQMVQGIYYLLAGLVEPFYFGFLWPALALALICGRQAPVALPPALPGPLCGGQPSWPSSWPTPWPPPGRRSSPPTSGPPWTGCSST